MASGQYHMVEQDFLGFINDNQLFNAVDRVLLAVSGGLDSMVMTELFDRISQPFAIAHVNFGLRSTESDEDAHFVENRAKRSAVPFHQIRFDTAAVAEAQGISIQMAARELRYNWFDQLLNDHHYTCVATAHHQNDVLETLLINLTRGTGLAGLHGIAARSARVVRPMLFATRDELATYAREQAVAYREDRSNADDKYARNRIRHHVVPVLTDLNPGLWHTLPRTVDRLRAAEVLMRADLDRSWTEVAQVQNGQTRLSMGKLLALPEPAFRLTEWLRPLGFSIDQIGQMMQALTRETGQVFQSATHRITHERPLQPVTESADNAGDLLLQPLVESADYEITLNQWPSEPIDAAGAFVLSVEQYDKPADFQPPTDATVACFDAAQIQFPVTIRPWRQGDRFQPLGLKGHKLVSDLLNELKLSRSEREQTAVLLTGDTIVWVIGHRIGHRFRITKETKQVCLLRLHR